MNALQEKTLLLHLVWIAEMIPGRVVAVLRTWRWSSHAKDSRIDRKRLGAYWAALSATTTALDRPPPCLLLCNKNKHKHWGHYLLDLLAWSWIYIYLIHLPHHLPEPLVFPQTTEDTYPRLTLSITKHPMLVKGSMFSTGRPQDIRFRWESLNQILLSISSQLESWLVVD